MGLINEQWKSLVKMLDVQKKQTTTTRLNGKNVEILEWVLDSRASNHMTGSTKFLSDL